jgi:hypothetical protein
MRMLAALALLVTLALAACGDDDGVTSPTPSPTPSATPASTPSPSATITPPAEQLSYVGPGGEIRLVDADGSGDRVFNDTICLSSDKGMDISGAWSPDGAALGLYCPQDLDRTRDLAIIGSDGTQLARVEDVGNFIWSPDSTRVAYSTGEFTVRLLHVSDGRVIDVHEDAALLDWAGPDTLLLGLSPVSDEMTMEFRANLFNIASGETTPVPRLNNQRSFWITPDGSRAVTLTDQWNPEGSARGMALYDFATAQETVIQGGYIGYPSQGVPHHQLAFSSDGGTIYWANAGSSVWKASLDSPEATKLGDVGSLFVAVSSSGLVASYEDDPADELGKVVIQDLATGTRAEVKPATLSFEWRPAVTP